MEVHCFCQIHLPLCRSRNDTSSDGNDRWGIDQDLQQEK